MEKKNTFELTKQEINSYGLANFIKTILSSGKREGNEWVSRNPKRTDYHEGSFKVNLTTGKWSDFATGDAGNDPISLVAYLETGGDQYKATKRIYEILGKSYPQSNYNKNSDGSFTYKDGVFWLNGWQRKTHSDKKPTYYYYNNADGSKNGCVSRFDFYDHKEKKQAKIFLQNSWDSKQNKWVGKWGGKDKPLYNLQQIVESGDKTILIVEGEKAAEAAKSLFPDYVVTTSCCGANGFASTDWAPLKGRNIIISPDNDEAGTKYKNNIIKKALHFEASSIMELLPKTLGLYTITNNEKQERLEVPASYDLADALQDGWTAELINEYIKVKPDFFQPFEISELKQTNPETLTKDEFIEQELEKRGGDTETFIIEGVDFLTSKSKNKLETLVREKNSEGQFVYQTIKLCSYIKPTSRVSSPTNPGVNIEFINRDGNLQEAFYPYSGTIDVKEVARELTKLCVQFPRLNDKTYNYVANYLHNFPLEKVAIGCDMIGWQHDEEVYLLPFADNHRRCYKTPNAKNTEFVLQSQNKRELRQKGSFKRWNDTVGKIANGNFLYMHAIGASLTAPILKLLNEEGFAFYFVGSSSIGKTTALHVASSVYGMGKPDSCRTTDNALESKLRDANDGLITLDEIAEIDADSLYNVAYMIGNGVTKARASKDGNAKNVSKFTVVALSTGEVGLNAKLSEKKRKSTAGQEVRFIEIDADMQKGHGTFNKVYEEFANSQEQAEYMKNTSAENCGWTIDEFMKLVTKNKEDFISQVTMIKEAWMDEVLPSILHKSAKADGQVKRVAKKFAICYAVLILAAQNGIVPFSEDEIDKCYKVLFKNWLKRRGGVDSKEYQDIKDRLYELITQKRASRFLTAANDTRALSDVAGYYSEGFYYIYTGVFENEILQGKTSFKENLKKDGYIHTNEEGKYYVKKTFKDNSRERFYKIPASILERESYQHSESETDANE